MARSRSPARTTVAVRTSPGRCGEGEDEALSVCIIGAGLAGLGLARALQARRPAVEVSIFDRQAVLKASLRTLDLERATGEAMRRLGLWDAWLSIQKPPDERGQDHSIGWALRDDLLAMIAASLRPGTLQMDRACVGLSEADDGTGRLMVELGEGGEVGPFDIVVAADGLQSVVRRFLLAPGGHELSGRVALLGDAQRRLGRELDAGLGRIRRGGNQALRGALELADVIVPEEGMFPGSQSPDALALVLGRLRHSPFAADLAISWTRWLQHAGSIVLTSCRKRRTVPIAAGNCGR
mmetsp:Transcript_28155/g.75123  ORF Transcript_28155/g.75123 Transcript_28155/m.75123 type:complete len:295 (-) Transcript_28155:4-888(-)